MSNYEVSHSDTIDKNWHLYLTRLIVYTISSVLFEAEAAMLKNITFSAEEDLIKRARERAAAERTTLNEEFRRWLEKYVERPETAEAFAGLMEHFDYIRPGGSFRRYEMNER